MVAGAADEEQPLILAIHQWEHQVQFVHPERDRMQDVARVEVRLGHQHHTIALTPLKDCTIIYRNKLKHSRSISPQVMSSPTSKQVNNIGN